MAICLAEAAIFSGCGASLDVRDDPVELFGEVGRARRRRVRTDCGLGRSRRVASELRRLAPRDREAGGDTLLGVELQRLRSAWEGSD